MAFTRNYICNIVKVIMIHDRTDKIINCTFKSLFSFKYTNNTA